MFAFQCEGGTWGCHDKQYNANQSNYLPMLEHKGPYLAIPVKYLDRINKELSSLLPLWTHEEERPKRLHGKKEAVAIMEAERSYTETDQEK